MRVGLQRLEMRAAKPARIEEEAIARALHRPLTHGGVRTHGQSPLGRDIEPVVLCADGSVRVRSKKANRKVGWGYLASNGLFGSGGFINTPEAAGSDPALVAELRAVAYALTHLAGADGLPACLVVLTDSQHAVNMMQRWRTGERVLPDGYPWMRGETRESALAVLRKRLARAPKQILPMWVPGHTGHRMNEAADALARMGSDFTERGMSNTESKERARFIADGFLVDPMLWVEVDTAVQASRR